MEDDIDIYEDLPSFGAKESEKYKEEIKDLSKKCNDFQQENTELKLKIAELSDNNKSLSVNLSSLLKTAKAEISRKDRMITELRQELDNMAFRRTGYVKPRAQEFSKKPAKNNTYTPAIRQEPFTVPASQAISYQDNTYASSIQQEPFPVPSTHPAPHQEFKEEIEEDPEQKYEPEKIATTVFGERLRKKILMEQEAERKQKEEAKRVMLENKETAVKAEVEESQQNGNATNLVKNELPEEPNNFVEEAALSVKSEPVSNGNSLNSYEEDERNLAERREPSNKLLGKRFRKEIPFTGQKRRRIEDERYHSDDTRYYNGNAQYENRFNQENNDNCRNPRNNAKHINRRRGSDNRDDVERDRRAPGERSKSNHRSRSRSPDRRYVEKRADRHRTDKYRAYMDTYEKRRNNGLNRINPYSNKFNKNAHDLRDKIDHRTDSKIGVRNDYNNYKNNKLDEERKKGRRESPPPARSRSRSNGRFRDKFVDEIGEGRSKSSNRVANISDEAREIENVKMRSKETKSCVDDRKKVVDEFKLEKSSRTSCERETTNKQVVSSAPLPEIYEKKRTDKQHISTTELPEISEKNRTDKQHISTTLLPDDSASLPKSDEVSEDISKLHKCVKTKSKDLPGIETKNCNPEAKSQMSKASSEIEVANKEIPSAQLLPNASEKEVTNQTLISTAQLPNVPSSTPKTCEVPEEVKKQLKIVEIKSKDSELAIPEQKNPDSESKSQIPSAKSCEKELTYKPLVSLELLPDASKKETTNQQIVSTPQLPSTSASAPESYEAHEILKKQRKDAMRKSKDSEPTIAEEKNSDPDPKSRMKLRGSCEKEVKPKQLDSAALLPEVSKKDLQNQQRDSTNQSLVGLASASESNDVPEEIKRERKGARRESKGPETSIVGEKHRDSKAKSQPASHKNSEKELTNKQLASSAPLPDASKNEVTNQQLATSTKIPSDSTSAEKSSEVPEEIKRQRKCSRTKLKDPAVNDHKDRNSKPKSPPMKTSSEKEVTNKKLAPTTELQDVSDFASGSREAPEEVKKQLKNGTRTSNDRKTTVTEEKGCNFKAKSHSPTKINTKKSETNENLVPDVPAVQNLISKLESDGINDEQKALNDKNTKPSPSLQIILNRVDDPGKSISLELENDAETPLQTFTDVGSRSFREEKIENIEKFIQNYQDEEDLCCQFSKRSTEDFECGNKSCDSTRSILDTLSMDIDVVAGCKPEEAALDNSLLSEQLLLESLSTPVKKNNPPLPSLPLSDQTKPPLPLDSPPEEAKQPPLPLNFPPEETKQPPLPPNSPPEETKQPPLPPNSPPEETKQPPLPPNSPPEETKQPPLPPNSPLEETKQPPLPPNSPPEETKQPPLPPNSPPEETKQPPLPPNSPLEETKQPPLPPNSPPEETKQPPLPPNSPPEETKQPPLPPNSPPEETKQPPLPPNSPPEETKQPPLPPNSPPEETKQAPLPLISPPEEMEIQSLPPISPPEEMEIQLLPLNSPPEETKQPPLPPTSPPEEMEMQSLPLLQYSDKKQRNSPPLSSPDEKKQTLPPLPSTNEKQQNLLSFPVPEEQKQNLQPLSSPVENNQTLPSLLPPNKSNQSSSSLSSQNKNQKSPLPSDKTENQELPSLSISDKKNQSIPLLTSSNDKKQRLSSPHPSPDYKKRRLLSSLIPSDEKTPPPSPLHRSGPIPQEKTLAPALEEKTKPDLLLVSAPQTKTDQSLFPTSADKTKRELLAQSTPIEKNDFQQIRKEGKGPEILAIPIQSQQDDLSQVGSEKKISQSSTLSVVTHKDDLPLSLPPVGHEKEVLQPSTHLPVSSKQEDPPLPLLTTPSEKINATSLQSPISLDKKLPPEVPVDNKSQSPAPVEKSPQSADPTDKESQSTGQIEEKSQPRVPTDKKSQPPVPVDKISECPVSTDKKSELPAPVVKLASAEENLPLSAPNENKDLPPPPTDKNNKISETKETSTRKPEPEKPRPEKVTLKAISRRRRTSCTAIVSRYSRKTRDLVLTDSDSSLCVAKSDVSSDNESNNNAKVEAKISSFITKEAKIILSQIKTPERKDTTSEKSISNPISKIAKPEKLTAAVNISDIESSRKIKSAIPIATSEHQTTKKVDPVPEIIPSMLPNVEIPSPQQHENNSEEFQSQMESKRETSPKPQNEEISSEIEKPICPKLVENRGSRLVLKTVVTPSSGGDSSSASANRKKPLPKEKENQSKQVAKPCKITIVARRRRPVTLEDSSTAATLVPSAQETNCDHLSKGNTIKNARLNIERPELLQTVSDPGSKGRKRRSVDK